MKIMDEKLLQIIEHYGISEQLKYIHSEYFELDEAIIEREDAYWYSPIQLNESYEEHIAEEIADVMVMLRQFQLYYEIKDEDIKKIMQEKIDRQIERIKKEK